MVTTMTGGADWLGIIVAALGGAAVGIERQRSGHASGPHARFGGVRTFALIGGAAGLAGWLTTLHFMALGIVLAAGAVALVIAGYIAASGDAIDATTEASALVVIGAGLAAGLGWFALASGIIAVCTLLLVEKSKLHALVGRIDDAELRAAARFGVMAVVILPLLPEGPFGPFGGIKPRELWLLVLFFTGLSFSGYLARRLVGPDRGYAVTGLLGGLISSTNVTFTFARLSRRERTLSGSLAVGAIGACTVLFPRVIVAACVLNLAVAQALLPYLVAPFLVGAVTVVLLWKGETRVEGRPKGTANPLQVGPALQMAAVFQIVLFAVNGARYYFGDSGLLASGAVLGLTDVDALTISMTKTAVGGAQSVAAQAIAIGILANCLLKCGLAVVLGTPRFRSVVGAVLAGMAAAIVISLAVMR
jgi:uncharacterized membrane protein (DUF4010 family)